jgi:predicted ferric reductase
MNRPESRSINWSPVPGMLLGAGVAAVLFALLTHAAQGSLNELATRLPWYVSRAAGITAYLLLSATTLFGLAISTRSFDRWIPRGNVTALHEHLSWLAFGLVGLHVGALLLDTYEPFRLSQILIPFTSHYRPVAVGVGVLSMYLMGIVIASFYVRRRIGQRAWRMLHYSTFALFVLATAHGIFAGSGAGDAWTQWLYLGCGAMAVFLTLYRILLEPRGQRKKVRV